jgi:FlaG/FlaF family flagellin (archaellin)
LRPRTIRRRARSGVSPVVAELCLIVVVLISTVVLSGLVFGTFSYFTSPAQVAAQAIDCTASGGSEVCHLVLDNLGSSGVSTDGACSMTVGGQDLAGSIENGGTVPPNGSLQGVDCVVSGAVANAGNRIGGTIALNDGALVYFTAMSD